MGRSGSLQRASLLLFLATVAVPLAAQPVSPLAQSGLAPARDQPVSPSQEPVGTARLTVLVVAADNGAPAKRAQVMLSGMAGTPVTPGASAAPTPAATAYVVMGGSVIAGPGGPGRVTREGVTDEGGRVEFAGLPAGIYSVLVRSAPAGFVRAPSTQSVRLRDGESASETVRLVRGGAIAGRVVDEAGDPMIHVSVRALAKDGGNGVPRLSPAGTPATTDDRGQFRIYEVPPGDYYVSAMSLSVYSASPASTTPFEPRVGYLPTFYPGAGSIDAAQAVTVKSAQDTAGVDFGMLRGRLGRIAGTAFDSAGAPLSTSGHLTLSTRNRELAYSTRGASARPDGSFVFPDVPPGDYYVTASVYDPPPSPGGGSVVSREGAIVPVSVSGDEVFVEIRTNKGAVLSGRVVREGPMPPPAVPGVPATPPTPQAMKVMVGARPPVSGPISPAFDPGKPEYFEEDGTFRITGARGSLMLTASSPVGVVKSIRRGAKELLGVPLDLTGTERIDDIEIVLTTETGAVAGTVTGRGGRPAPGAWVLVFPEDANRWSQPFVSIARAAGSEVPPTAAPVPGAATMGSQTAGAPTAGGATRPRGPGEFVVARLLPGRYLAVALDGAGGSPPSADAELLASLRSKAVTVTVTAGESATVQLRL